MPRYQSIARRALASLVIIIVVLTVGTIGIHYINHYPYVESFYTISMIATGQGPPGIPPTDAGMIFESIMAFVSVGSVLVSLAFVFGPFIGDILKVTERKIKEEEKALRRRSGGSR